MIQYWGVRFLAWMAQVLPLPVAYALATFVGDIVYLLWWRGRTNTIHNFRHVLGPETPEIEVRRTARRSFHNYHRAMVDFLRLPRLTPEQAMARINVRGWEHLEAAFAQGKGVLLIGLHFGNWDLAGLALAARHYPVNALADGFGSRQLEAWIRRSREARGVKIIPVSGLGLRQVYRALKRNEVVGIIFDRPAGAEGVPVRFFGEETRWPPGPAVLALRTKAPVIVGYLVRRPDGTYEGEMRPVGPFSGDHRVARDVQTVTQAIVSHFEDFIRRYPDQWYMFRRMWPTPGRVIHPSTRRRVNESAG